MRWAVNVGLRYIGSMNKALRIKTMLNMYKSLTDPDIKIENKRKELKKKRAETKKADTGL